MSRNKNQKENTYCEVCGNDLGPCFEVHMGGEKHVFDSFECAMRAFAPRCGNCGCELLGHGIVVGDSLYCSYQCANDRVARENERRVMLREQANL
jgi:hypothetical protein